MEFLTSIGLAAPAGLNAYIPLLSTALAQRFGWISLPEPYALLGEWWAIALISVLLLVEIVADKVPAVDHANDVVQTVVRPAAGGLLFAAGMSETGLNQVAAIVAGVLLAGGVHAAKASVRPVVNTATGGVGAPVVSAAEDGVAVGLSLAALLAPLLIGLLLGALLVAGLWWWRSRRERVPQA